MKHGKKKKEISEVPFGKTVIYYNKDALSFSDKIGGKWENYEFSRDYPVWPKIAFYGYRDPEAYCYHHDYPYYILEIVEHGELEVTLRRDAERVTELYSGKVIPVVAEIQGYVCRA